MPRIPNSKLKCDHLGQREAKYQSVRIGDSSGKRSCAFMFDSFFVQFIPGDRTHVDRSVWDTCKAPLQRTRDLWVPVKTPGDGQTKISKRIEVWDQTLRFSWPTVCLRDKQRKLSLATFVSKIALFLSVSPILFDNFENLTSLPEKHISDLPVYRIYLARSYRIKRIEKERKRWS